MAGVPPSTASAGDAICPRCGRLPPRDAPLGLCPHCLMRTAVAARSVGLPASSGDAAPALVGDYELLELLGEGGQGSVFRARQRSLDRIVALKLLRGGPAASSVDVARFRAEATAAAALHHPGIVGVYEIGEQAGRPYYTMEFVDGVDLGRLIAEERVSPEWSARCVARLADALQVAHDHGILHRDLKPSNVLLDGEDQPRIADFGLARRLDEAAQLTLSHQALGTPGYAAPELADPRRQPAGRATDVYGAGAILYFLLTGRPPFVGETLPDVLRQVVEAEPVAPGALRPGLPRDLETICLKCLHKEPARRYPTAQALAADLQRFLRREPIVARPVGLAERAWRWCHRQPGIAALTFGLAAAVLVITLGSVLAAYRINRARLAEQDQRERTGRAVEAYQAILATQELNGRAGQRLGNLDAIAKAAALGPVSRQITLDLRKRAITALTLTDLRETWHREFRQGEEFAAFDQTLTAYAVAGTNGVVSVRRVSDDHEVQRLIHPVGPEPWLPQEFSANGRWLAERTARLDRVRVWNLVTGRPGLEVSGRYLAFSPDARRVVIAEEPHGVAVYMLEAELKAEGWAPDVHGTGAVFDPAGRRVAVTGTSRPGDLPVLVILEASSGAEVQRLFLRGGANVLAWHPDGRQLVLASEEENGAIQVYDVATASRVKVIRGHANSVRSLAFGAGGDVLASAAWDGTVRLWSYPAGRELLREAGLGYLATPLDGDRLAMMNWELDGLSIFDLVGPAAEVRRFELEEEPRKGGEVIAFNANGRVLAHTGGERGAITLRDAATLQPFAVLTNRAFELVVADQTSVGFLMADGRLFRLPLAPGPLAWTECGTLPAGRFSPMRLAADARQLAAKDDRGRVALVDLADPNSIRALGTDPQARNFSISPDGCWVASGAWNTKGVRVWNAATRQLERELPTESGAGVAFTPDGQWLITTGKRIVFWRPGTWEPVREIGRPARDWYPSPVAFSRDGRWLALCPEAHAVRLVNPDTLEEYATLALPDPWWICSLSFSPDGTRLAVSGELTREFCVWDLPALRARLAALKLDWDSPEPERRAQPSGPSP